LAQDLELDRGIRGCRAAVGDGRFECSLLVDESSADRGVDLVVAA
jgi:hypothetical protein